MFLALVAQHAMRMPRIMSSMTCLALLYFSTLSHKRRNFQGKKLLDRKCVFLFSVLLLPETFLILRRTERDMTKKKSLLVFTQPIRDYSQIKKKTLIFSIDF